MRKVVFDLDDTLWRLNERAANIAGIDSNLLNCFLVTENTLLTPDQKERVLKIYQSKSLWDNISYESGYERLKDLEQYDCKVYINSNCITKEVADYKRSFLSKDLGLPDKQIILNVEKSSTEKEMLDNTYIFIDDSPFNIANSNAKYTIIPNRLWNQDVKNDHTILIRCDTLNEIIDTIIGLLK